MSTTAQPGAPYGPGGWGPPRSAWSPWSLVWSVPKPWLIAAMVLAFILFWPIGLAILFFAIGSGRLGGRWARGQGFAGGGPANAGGCGWQGSGSQGWRRDEASPAGSSSGNAAFDEYRMDTLRRLEEEQRDFAAFLERLRFAKDKAEFDQFMADRRRRPAEPPAQDVPPQG